MIASGKDGHSCGGRARTKRQPATGLGSPADALDRLAAAVLTHARYPAGRFSALETAL
jgi:hypothetical protein